MKQSANIALYSIFFFIVFMIGGVVGAHLVYNAREANAEPETTDTTVYKERVKSLVQEYRDDPSHRQHLSTSAKDAETPHLFNLKTTYTPIKLATSSIFERGNCPEGNSHNYPKFFEPMGRHYDIGNYIPSHLVRIEDHIPTKYDKEICLDETTAVHLNHMIHDAEQEGHHILVTSGYRSRNTQENLYNGSIRRNGRTRHLRVAEAGHSEHQLGTTVDLSGKSIDEASAAQSFGDSPEGLWVQENAHRYGFIMSYPEGSEDETGYIHEPWHWRFVGTENVEKFLK